MSLSSDIVNWIRERVKEAKAKGVVVGLSGGIDSSCVAVLSKIALGKNVLGLILPCESNPRDEKFARLLAKKFKIKVEKIVLDPIYEKFREILPKANKIAFANLKPRLRMITLYYFANKLNYLVAGCGNKSEITVGYFTKYGDGGVDILPIGGLLKTEVRTLARQLKIPNEIIERGPTAGLWQGQTDELELGVTYENLDRAISSIENGKVNKFYNQKIITKVKNLIDESQHKRLAIPVYKKTSR